MNGAHDMGGCASFGAVVRESEEPVFHARWEARFFAIANLLDGGWPLDEDRHACENRPSAEYLRNSYYETWLAALETLVSRHHLDHRSATTPALSAVDVLPSMMKRGSYVREVATRPVFSAGDLVAVRNLSPAGHTRLPAYLRGKTGQILVHHGAHVFPDFNAHGKGENPQHLYTVRFNTANVFGGRANDLIHADLWEPYLERV